jgi:cytidine deaminase
LGVPAERVGVTLIEQAREAVAAAYAPYSEYAVGAALETAEGTVYTGCNIENANYSNSLHAEEVALGTAVRDGHRAFARLAVTSAARDGVTPCGMCRQTLAEFCPDEFEILCDTGEGVETYALGDLLPDTITAANLEGVE